MNDEGRGRFSGVSQFAIGPSEGEIRERDRREPRGAAGFFTAALADGGAGGVFSAGVPAAEGAADFFGPGAGAPTDSARFTFAAFGTATAVFAVRPEGAGALRSGAAAFLATGFVAGDFFAIGFFAAGLEALPFGIAPRFAVALAADAIFLATFLTAAFTRLLTDLTATGFRPFTAGFRALTAGFRAFTPGFRPLTAGFRVFDGAVFFRLAGFLAPGDPPFAAGFPLEPLTLVFNDLADPEAGFRAPDV